MAGRERRLGSVAPGCTGGYRPFAIGGEHRLFVLQQIGKRPHVTLQALSEALAARGLKVHPATVGRFLARERKRFKNRSAPPGRSGLTWRAGAGDGSIISTGSARAALSSSTKPGSRPTARTLSDQRRGVQDPCQGRTRQDPETGRRRRSRQSQQSQGQGAARHGQSDRRQAVLSAVLQSRSQPSRAGLRKNQHAMRKAMGRSVEAVERAVAETLDTITPGMRELLGKCRIQVNLNAKRSSAKSG
jgi:hypothetical protein